VLSTTVRTEAAAGKPRVRPGKASSARAMSCRNRPGPRLDWCAPARAPLGRSKWKCPWS
jgi:hypothetical protein